MCQGGLRFNLVSRVGQSGVMWEEEIHCEPKENLLCEMLKQNGDSVLKTLWVAAAVLTASAGHLTVISCYQLLQSN